MKKLKTIPVYLVLLSLIFCITSCCNCGDAQLTKVDSRGALTLRFKVITEVLHSNGRRTSSTSFVDNFSTINLPTVESVTTNVYLIATDSLSGVKCLELSGDFEATCQNLPVGGAITFHGKLPNPRQCLPLTTCCLIQNEIKLEDISQYLECNASRRISSGGIRVYGIAQSCSGLIDTVYVDFNPTITF